MFPRMFRIYRKIRRKIEKQKKTLIFFWKNSFSQQCFCCRSICCMECMLLYANINKYPWESADRPSRQITHAGPYKIWLLSSDAGVIGVYLLYQRINFVLENQTNLLKIFNLFTLFARLYTSGGASSFIINTFPLWCIYRVDLDQFP